MFKEVAIYCTLITVTFILYHFLIFVIIVSLVFLIRLLIDSVHVELVSNTDSLWIGYFTPSGSLITGGIIVVGGNDMDGHKISLQFVQELVAKTESDVTAVSFKVSAGAGRGDNYTSSLYRVLVLGTQSTPDGPKEWKRSYIYKQLPDSSAHRQLYRSDVLFQNEVSFYKETFASLIEFQDNTGVSEPFSAVPRCFAAEQGVIVLEDLKERGFVMGNRKEGLDYQHCVVVFREIARFHALSLAMKCQDPVGFKEKVSSKAQEVFFTEQNEEYYRNYYGTVLKNALSTVDKGLLESERSTYINKFKEFLDERIFFKTMINLVKPTEPMAVLAHGDFWTNNMMFQYAENEQVCFVDFQFARYCSPALDLLNFFYSCMPPEARAIHMDNLLAEYCQALRDNLTTMGCSQGTSAYCNGDNIPQLIQHEVQVHRKIGLGLALDMIPIVTCDSAVAPDLYETETGVHESVTPFGSEYSPECQRRLVALVKELVDQGHL